MAISGRISFPSQSIPVLSVIRSGAMAPRGEPAFLRSAATAPPPPRAFITISREAGAGGTTLAHSLARYLDERDPPNEATGAAPWSVWDRELIEKVVADHHVPRQLVASIEESGSSWLTELFSGLAMTSGADADETRVYRRVIDTVRALMRAGRVVIVGRGGVFIARHDHSAGLSAARSQGGAVPAMHPGVHVRLVAPIEQRVRHMQSVEHLTRPAALRRVDELDRHRAAFYRRYWRDERLAPELFTVTLNTAELGEQQMVEAVAAMVPREPQVHDEPVRSGDPTALW